MHTQLLDVEERHQAADYEENPEVLDQYTDNQRGLGVAGKDLYQNLYSSSKHIRLLELLPESADLEASPKPWYEHVNIRCNLIVVAIDKAPPYDALSYTWGNDEPSIEITINGNKVMVRRNLADALGALRGQSSRHLWNDALCINQISHQERSHQVQLMGDIYRHAVTVFIWLGRSEARIENASEKVISLLKRFSRAQPVSRLPPAPPDPNVPREAEFDRWIEDLKASYDMKEKRTENIWSTTGNPSCENQSAQDGPLAELRARVHHYTQAMSKPMFRLHKQFLERQEQVFSAANFTVQLSEDTARLPIGSTGVKQLLNRIYSNLGDFQRYIADQRKLLTKQHQEGFKVQKELGRLDEWHAIDIAERRALSDLGDQHMAWCHLERTQAGALESIRLRQDRTLQSLISSWDDRRERLLHQGQDPGLYEEQQRNKLNDRIAELIGDLKSVSEEHNRQWVRSPAFNPRIDKFLEPEEVRVLAHLKESMRDLHKHLLALCMTETLSYRPYWLSRQHEKLCYNIYTTIECMPTVEEERIQTRKSLVWAQTSWVRRWETNRKREVGQWQEEIFQQEADQQQDKAFQQEADQRQDEAFQQEADQWQNEAFQLKGGEWQGKVFKLKGGEWQGKVFKLKGGEWQCKVFKLKGGEWRGKFFKLKAAKRQDKAFKLQVSQSSRDEMLSALDEFCGLRYWNRLWIVQEVLLARKPVLCFGDDIRTTHDWSLLSEARRCLDSIPAQWDSDASVKELTMTVRQSLPFLLDRLRDSREKGWPLRRLIEITEASRCTHPRDKVYGLLGLANDCHKDDIVPDINKSTQEVFLDTITWYHRKYGGDDFCPGIIRLSKSMQLSFKNFDKPSRQEYIPEPNLVRSPPQQVTGTQSSLPDRTFCVKGSQKGPIIDLKRLLDDSMLLALRRRDWIGLIAEYLNFDGTHNSSQRIETELVYLSSIEPNFAIKHQTTAYGTSDASEADIDSTSSMESLRVTAQRHRSNDEQQFFMLENGQFGVTSTSVREGDILCEFEDQQAALILRRITGRRFALVSRAILSRLPRVPQLAVGAKESRSSADAVAMPKSSVQTPDTGDQAEDPTLYVHLDAISLQQLTEPYEISRKHKDRVSSFLHEADFGWYEFVTFGIDTEAEALDMSLFTDDLVTENVPSPTTNDTPRTETPVPVVIDKAEALVPIIISGPNIKDPLLLEMLKSALSPKPIISYWPQSNNRPLLLNIGSSI